MWILSHGDLVFFWVLSGERIGVILLSFAVRLQDLEK